MPACSPGLPCSEPPPHLATPASHSMLRCRAASAAGVACDVGDAASVDALVAAASSLLGGGIDCWVNNAGYSGSFQVPVAAGQACGRLLGWAACCSCCCSGAAAGRLGGGVCGGCRPAGCPAVRSPPGCTATPPPQGLLDQPAEQVQRVVRTNLLGTLLASRAAIHAMAAQPGGGTMFNMEGAGADGAATPQVGGAGLRLCAFAACCACSLPPLLPHH